MSEPIPSEAGREPAPEPLRTVQELINTRDLEAGTEELRTPDELAAWLRGHGLLTGPQALTAGDLERMLAVREALRALLDERAHEGAVSAATRDALRAGYGGAVLAPAFGEDGAPALVPAAEGLDGALARLHAIVAAAAREGTWSRLKVCGNAGCRWAFYDRSKNRSGSWCSMAVCGNRAKARSFRSRNR